MSGGSRLQASFAGRSVLVTGHTGFKGSWLCEWLLLLGARVTGFSLPPPTEPALFEQLALSSRINHVLGDVRDLAAIGACVQAAQPDFVFHLAAQPLVRLSYREPVETYSTNVLGTVHLLEAVRCAARPCVVVCVTTDKCYENREWLHAYREEDALGGYDPYSSSKAAAELVTGAYRRSFFQNDALSGVALASGRAGNVIGGGDWALDRIVPDCMRALDRGEAIAVRNPHATRPWQHVLEPLGGYLTLAGALAEARAAHDPERLAACASAFNFGPQLDSNRNVGALVTELLKHRPGSWLDQSDPAAPHEAGRLNLAIDKAFHLLDWQPVWGFERSIAETVRWYLRAPREDTAGFTRGQIEAYLSDATKAGQGWAR
ncbi:MAG: CDP-glucose 4,6-dehydratase [Chthoniobacteraceae bacterium]